MAANSEYFAQKTEKSTEMSDSKPFVGHILAIEINDFLPSGSGSGQRRSRVIPNILHLLDHIDKYRAEGNFYISGELMRSFPEIVSLVSSRGHEIGLCCDIRGSQCVLNVGAFKKEMEQITSHRATGVLLKSVGGQGRARLKQLAEKGFRYCLTDFKLASRGDDVMPIKVKFNEYNAIDVFPPSTYNLAGINLKFGQPGKIRLYPFWFLRKCIRKYTHNEKPVVINFPLWEFDPHLPRQILSPLQSLKSYGNLSLAEFKLTRLLLEFDFVAIPQILDPDEKSG